MEQANLNLNRQKSEQNNSRYIYLALSKLKTSEIKALNEIKETYGGFSHLLGLSVEKICSDTGLKNLVTIYNLASGFKATDAEGNRITAPYIKVH